MRTQWRCACLAADILPFAMAALWPRGGHNSGSHTSLPVWSGVEGTPSSWNTFSQNKAIRREREVLYFILRDNGLWLVHDYLWYRAKRFYNPIPSVSKIWRRCAIGCVFNSIESFDWFLIYIEHIISSSDLSFLPDNNSLFVLIFFISYHLKE